MKAGTSAPLELSRISKSYNGFQALHNISLSVSPGEILAVIGADSAGKSTLAKIICGLEYPDSGHLVLDHVSVIFRSVGEARDYGIELASRDEILSDSLDIAHTIFLGRYPRKLGFLIDKKEMYKQTRYLLDKAGLPHLSERQAISELSGGIRQIIAIIRAAAFHPRFMIYDEPMMNLSANAVTHAKNFIRSLADTGTAQIIATRQPEEILDISHRIIVMRRGRIITEIPAAKAIASELNALMIL